MSRAFSLLLSRQAEANPAGKLQAYAGLRDASTCPDAHTLFPDSLSLSLSLSYSSHSFFLYITDAHSLSHSHCRLVRTFTYTLSEHISLSYAYIVTHICSISSIRLTCTHNLLFLLNSFTYLNLVRTHTILVRTHTHSYTCTGAHHAVCRHPCARHVFVAIPVVLVSVACCLLVLAPIRGCRVYLWGIMCRG